MPSPVGRFVDARDVVPGRQARDDNLTLASSHLRLLPAAVDIASRVIGSVLVGTQMTAQVAGIVAGTIESAESRFLEHLLAFTVFLGFIVLLSVFDESSSAANCPPRAILLEPLFTRSLGRT